MGVEETGRKGNEMSGLRKEVVGSDGIIVFKQHNTEFVVFTPRVLRPPTLKVVVHIPFIQRLLSSEGPNVYQRNRDIEMYRKGERTCSFLFLCRERRREKKYFGG